MDKNELLKLTKDAGDRPSVKQIADMIHQLKGVTMINDSTRCHMIRALLWSIGFKLEECIPLSEKITYGNTLINNDLEGDEIHVMHIDDLSPDFMFNRPPSLDITGG